MNTAEKILIEPLTGEFVGVDNDMNIIQSFRDEVKVSKDTELLYSDGGWEYDYENNYEEGVEGEFTNVRKYIWLKQGTFLKAGTIGSNTKKVVMVEGKEYALSRWLVDMERESIVMHILTIDDVFVSETKVFKFDELTGRALAKFLIFPKYK